MNVQYGCGLSAPPNWINFDVSPTLRMQRNPAFRYIFRSLLPGPLFPATVRCGDIVRGLPLPSEVADAVYCSHVLEHLASSDVNKALIETFRIMKPGATFRLVVPDLKWRVRKYLNEGADSFTADDLMKSTMLGCEERSRLPMGRIRSVFGNSRHLWMFDFESMQNRLLACGFVDVRRCNFGDAKVPSFTQVEDANRFQEGSEPELAIEALRPVS